MGLCAEVRQTLCSCITDTDSFYLVIGGTRHLDADSKAQIG